MLPEHSLEREFALHHLNLHLQQYPEQAAILAVNHYEDFLSLSDDYKRLYADYEVLLQENARLKSSLINRHSPQLPSFFNQIDRL